MDKDTIEYKSGSGDTSVEFIKPQEGLVIKLKAKGIATMSIKIDETKFQELIEFLNQYKKSQKSLSEKELKELKDHFNMTEGLYL